MKRDKRVILALDVLDADVAIDLASKLSGYVDAIKIGYPLILSSNLDLLSRISKIAPVIADLKVADIPNTNRLICESVFEAEATGVIAHAFVGEDSLKACRDVAYRFSGELFVVTEMSHPGALQFMAPLAEEMARLAVKVKADGIVAPATRPERIKTLRQIVGGMAIISPGVGAQGGSALDTLNAGADYIIVGRSIYGSSDPLAAMKRLYDEINVI